MVFSVELTDVTLLEQKIFAGVISGLEMEGPRLH